jgi:hypothetical protein
VTRIFFPLLVFAAVGCHEVAAVENDAQPDSNRFAEQVRPLLVQYCWGCHGPEVQEAELRLDRVAPTFDTGGAARWRRVLERVELGQMPPASEQQPSAQEIRTLSGWIKDELRSAELARRAREGRVVYRGSIALSTRTPSATC